MSLQRIDIQENQRYAFEVLSGKIPGYESYEVNRYKKITGPAMVIQEQAFVNTTNNYLFQFGSTSTGATAVLNNVTLGENNIFAAYGMQILIGQGATANNRVYRSRGLTQDDNSLYNAVASMSFESDTPVQKIDMQSFYQEGDRDTQYDGLVLIQPLRILTGRVANWSVNIVFNNAITGLTLTSNLFISVRLHGVLGLA